MKEAKTGQKDEHISPEQIIARYRGVCSSSSVQTLSKMDFNKIDYDLIETVLVHIVDSAPKSRGSILVFLPGTQKNLNNFFNPFLAQLFMSFNMVCPFCLQFCY